MHCHWALRQRVHLPGQSAESIRCGDQQLQTPLCHAKQAKCGALPAGHVWTTSLGRKLLRLAGPCHPNSGTLLQTVDLVQLLPPFARQLYPMDVQAAVQVQAGGSTAVQRTAGVQGHCGVGDQDPTPGSGHAMLSQHTSSSSSLMVVTLHSGSKVPAAVAVLRVHERVLVEGPQHDSSGTQEGHVCLVNCWQDRLLQQPNMVAIQ
jgi:hypothetical protein